MNIKYNYNKKIENLIENQIFITGFTRSGTSIFSLLMGSLDNALLSFEPMMINLLLSFQNNSKKELSALYKSYFFEDFYLSYKNGRNYNFNTDDDSNISKYKSKNYITKSLSNSKRRFELIENLKNDERIIIKCANIFFDNKKLNDFSIRNLIIMIRQPDDVLKSVIKKKWLGNKYSKKGYTKSYKEINKEKVPFHINRNELKFWKSLNNYERCCWEIKKFNEMIFKLKIRGLTIVDYDDFCKRPNLFFHYFKKLYRLKETKKSREILRTIKPLKKENFNFEKYKNNLSSKLYYETIRSFKKIHQRRLIF